MKKTKKQKLPLLAKYLWSNWFLATIILTIIFVGLLVAMQFLEKQSDIIFLSALVGLWVSGIAMCLAIVVSIIKAAGKRGLAVYGSEPLQ